MKRAVGTKFLCYQCGHRWLNEYQYVERCPKCKHRGFNWKQEPNLDGEEWRDCSLLGKHQISNYGRLKSTIQVNAMYVGKIIKGSIDRCGYIRYHGPLFAHSLVAHEFIGPKPKGHECNHKDGNKLNNHISNLEYLTIPNHKKHAMDNNMIAYGERSGLAKLTENDVFSIFSLKERGMTHAAIGAVFNVDESNISCITRGITWRRSRDKYANQIC